MEMTADLVSSHFTVGLIKHYAMKAYGGTDV
jgi:hypothetical protein